MSNLKLFESKQIRSVCYEQEQEWYFSVPCAIEVLTDSVDVKQYINRMLSRDEQLKPIGVQFVPWLKWMLQMAKDVRFRLLLQKVYYELFNPSHHPKRNLSNSGWHRPAATGWMKLKIQNWQQKD